MPEIVVSSIEVDPDTLAAIIDIKEAMDDVRDAYGPSTYKDALGILMHFIAEEVGEAIN